MSTPQGDAVPGNAGPSNQPAPPVSTQALAAALGLVVLVALNAAAYAFLKPMSIGADTLGPGQDSYDSFYDGCVAVFTLALPAFLAGLSISRIAKAASLNVSIFTFAVAAIVGAVHQFWQVPIVSPHSAHSGLMHYMLSNPIVIMAFGTLGGWLGGEFATGRFTLADREKPYLPGLDED